MPRRMPYDNLCILHGLDNAHRPLKGHLLNQSSVQPQWWAHAFYMLLCVSPGPSWRTKQFFLMVLRLWFWASSPLVFRFPFQWVFSFLFPFLYFYMFTFINKIINIFNDKSIINIKMFPKIWQKNFSDYN